MVFLNAHGDGTAWGFGTVLFELTWLASFHRKLDLDEPLCRTDQLQASNSSSHIQQDTWLSGRPSQSGTDWYQSPVDLWLATCDRLG